VSIDWTVWVGFVTLIVVLLALDLFVFHRSAHEVSVREAGLWSAVWVGLGLGFGAFVWAWLGGTAAAEYLAGYLIEKSLSVDNIFVFAMIFSAFGVPAAYQHRVLFWGIFGALVLRAIFILAGAALLQTFHWTIYLFGGLLVATGIRMVLASEHEIHPERNPLLRALRRVVPMTADYHGQSLFVRQAGRWMATPLLAVLLVVETSDVIFAVDSIPAILAITDEAFLVFSSNAFALLGLRALYFVLAGSMDRFPYLKYGLAAILVLVGVKMIASDVYHVPIWASLTAIGVILLASGVAPLLFRSRQASETDRQPGTAA
jgi:tellurite resistance protein TerC